MWREESFFFFKAYSVFSSLDCTRASKALIAAPGWVDARSLCAVISHPSQLQSVSTIAGWLNSNSSLFEKSGGIYSWVNMPDPISSSLTAASQHPTGCSHSRAPRGACIDWENLRSDPAKGLRYTWGTMPISYISTKCYATDEVAISTSENNSDIKHMIERFLFDYHDKVLIHGLAQEKHFHVVPNVLRCLICKTFPFLFNHVN